MGLDVCSSANACPLHFIWTRTKENILETLKRTTLTQMRKKVGKLRFREFTRPRLQMKLGLTKVA
jgi:DNA-binding IscR family transcriptional regulator